MGRGEGGSWSMGVYLKFYQMTPFLYELNTDFGEITLFSDAPHLFKTVPNAPSNSGLEKGTR